MVSDTEHSHIVHGSQREALTVESWAGQLLATRYFVWKRFIFDFLLCYWVHALSSFWAVFNLHVYLSRIDFDNTFFVNWKTVLTCLTRQRMLIFSRTTASAFMSLVHFFGKCFSSTVLVVGEIFIFFAMFDDELQILSALFRGLWSALNLHFNWCWTSPLFITHESHQ